jgi:DNA-binding transcriptional LysR family regulator
MRPESTCVCAKMPNSKLGKPQVCAHQSPELAVDLPLPPRSSGRGRAASMPARLRSLDLHHLMVLNLLLQEFSVIKVAAKVNQSQPAISRMLRRLRDVLGDELLVRSGSKLVPTEWALAIRTPLREIMAHVSRIEIDTHFDPETTEREFKIACADCIETSLLPSIIAKLISVGPRIRVKLRLIDPAYDVPRALEEGELDLAIDNSPHPPDQLMISTLYSDEVVCMMRVDHPLANSERISLAAYLSVQHLAPHPSSRQLGPIDGELARIGYKRNIAATVPEFNMAPYVLTRTDLIFTTGRMFAEHYARILPLRIVPAPPELPRMKFYQLWHERSHISVSHVWLRQQVLDVVRQHLQPLARQPPNLISLDLVR